MKRIKFLIKEDTCIAGKEYKKDNTPLFPENFKDSKLVKKGIIEVFEEKKKDNSGKDNKEKQSNKDNKNEEEKQVDKNKESNDNKDKNKDENLNK